MNYTYHKPNPLLAEYVRTVLILEGSSAPDPHRLPLFTNGMPALLCRVEKDGEGQKISILSLFGKSTSPECWSDHEQTTVIAFFFKPFAMATLFNIPAAILKTTMNLSQWNPHRTNALKTQLLYAATTDQKAEALESMLIHQLKENKKECELIRYATDQILLNSGTEILSTLAGQINIGERTFQRTFKKYVGVTANQYRRICQFQLSFAQLNEGKFTRLTDVAFDNGFADQSHFIRSFREFAKKTPQRYMKSGLDRNSH